MYLENLIKKAYETASKKKWDTIYVMIDIHDTIAESNYKDCDVTFYPQAIAALHKISKLPEIYLSLYTCCYEHDAKTYISKLKKLGIDIKSINTTPIKNTLTGCFDKKPYFSILIDDKAGFNPNDWEYTAELFYKYRSIIKQQTEFDFDNYKKQSEEIILNNLFDNNFKSNIEDKEEFIKLCGYLSDKGYIFTKTSENFLWKLNNNNILITLKDNVVMRVSINNNNYIIFANQPYTLNKFIKVIKENI